MQYSTYVLLVTPDFGSSLSGMTKTKSRAVPHRRIYILLNENLVHRMNPFIHSICPSRRFVL